MDQIQMAFMVQNQQDALTVTQGGLSDCRVVEDLSEGQPEETVFEEVHA